MKIAQEFQGYYLDIYYKDGIICGIIRNTGTTIEELTYSEVVKEFKNIVLNIAKKQKVS